MRGGLCLHASDFFPNPKEEQSMRYSLDVQEKSIQTLDVQISSLEALVAELVVRRTILIESSSVQRALLSPVRKLAPELLGEIFEFCMPQTDEPMTITEDCAPLLFGRVCKRWRRVAASTPRLWTTIDCRLQCTVNPLVIIPTFLKQSGSLPIDIFLGESLEKLHHSKTNPNPLHSCLQLMNTHFHRCRSFSGTSSGIISMLFPTNHSTVASSLRSFQITASVKSDPTITIGNIVAPKLETIDVCQSKTILDSITMDHGLLRVFRWDASMSSGYRENSIMDLSEVLMLYTNIEECQLKLPTEPFGPFVRDATVMLPKLRRLTLGFPMTTDPGDLFDIIDAPALEYLCLEQTSPLARGPDISRALRCLVSATSPRLREIHLKRMIFSSEVAFVAPFTALSNLESLNIHQSFIHTPFLAALTPNSGDTHDSWMLPKLSSICLNDCGVLTEDLVHMIERRLDCDPAHEPTLNSVSLIRCQCTGPGLDTLRALPVTRPGFRVNIVNRYMCVRSSSRRPFFVFFF